MIAPDWPLLKEEALLRTPVFEVRRRVCRSPKDGGEKNFFVLDSPDWAQVLPITPDGQAVLVRQFRHGIREASLELPGGVIERGQKPLDAAQRELREETGYTAPRWRPMAAFRPNPAVNVNTAHFFLAEGVEPTAATEFDENEDIDLILRPAADLAGMVLRGEVTHAIMCAAILFYCASERRF